jgi:MFS family permease
LKNRGLQAFLLFRAFFTSGINMQGTLLAWFVYEVSHDPLALGLVGLAEVIPYVSILMVGGVLADRFSRKKLILVSLFCYVLISLGLWYLSLQHSINPNAMSLSGIYLLVFLTGLSRGILSPSQNAILGQLVPRSEITKASVWNSGIFQAGAVGGPALGGFVYAWLGPITGFGIVAALIGLSFLSSFLLPETGKVPQMQESVVSRMRNGMKFVWQHPILLSGMAMDMVAVLFGGAVAVLPLFADQILHVGPQGLGWLRAAPALGSVLMAAVMLRFPPGKSAGKILLWCVAGFGASNLIFALSTSFWLSMAMLFLGGLLDNVSAVIRMTLVQLFTPEEMKGRVSAVNSIFIGSSNELGAFESGVAARYLGLVSSVVYGAWITFATVGFTAWKSPALRNLDLTLPQEKQ